MSPRRFALLTLLACLLAPIPGVARSQPAPDLTQFDNARYARLLTRHVNPQGLVDYATLKANRADLDAYLAEMGRLEPMTYAAWNGAAKLAFWINAYNALTLRNIIGHYPLPSAARAPAWPANSPRQIPGMWDDLRLPIMGQPRSLDDIMHQVLRREFADPRVHVALVCGTRGAPPLRAEPYDAHRLDEQLHAQAERMLADPRRLMTQPARRVVRLSPIFQWFGADFLPIYESQAPPDNSPTPREAVLWFIAQHSPRHPWNELQASELDFLPYDWTLNGQ